LQGLLTWFVRDATKVYLGKAIGKKNGPTLERGLSGKMGESTFI